MTSPLLDYAPAVRRSRAWLLSLTPTAACLSLVLMPYVYFGVEYYYGRGWPSAMYSRLSVRDVPFAIHYSWLIGMIGSVVNIVALVMAGAMTTRIRGRHVLMSLFMTALTWCCFLADPGNLFQFLTG